MCLHIRKTFEFRWCPDVPIGELVLVVEGEETEPELFVKIFNEILGYKIISKTRDWGDADFVKRVYQGSRQSDGDKHITIINTKNSSIASIDKHELFRNKIFTEVALKYGVDFKHSPVFYIWDRDRGNNTNRCVRKLVDELCFPDEENVSYDNGLLILSYPAIEGYIKSAFEDTSSEKSESLRSYKKIAARRIDEIGPRHLLKATSVMNKTLKTLGIEHDIDVDNFHDDNILIFDKEEQEFEDNKKYIVLSMISLIFLYLGVIEKEDR